MKRKITIKDKYPRINYLPTCPDCKKQVKRLIDHHIITHRLAKYLIDTIGYDRKEVMNLRGNLKLTICQNCEKKFHNGDFYKHNFVKEDGGVK